MRVATATPAASSAAEFIRSPEVSRSIELFKLTVFRSELLEANRYAVSVAMFRGIFFPLRYHFEESVINTIVHSEGHHKML